MSVRQNAQLQNRYVGRALFARQFLGYLPNESHPGKRIRGDRESTSSLACLVSFLSDFT
jgi:hypothetical protein